jgi:hypothetical protein
VILDADEVLPLPARGCGRKYRSVRTGTPPPPHTHTRPARARALVRWGHPLCHADVQVVGMARTEARKRWSEHVRVSAAKHGGVGAISPRHLRELNGGSYTAERSRAARTFSDCAVIISSCFAHPGVSQVGQLKKLQSGYAMFFDSVPSCPAITAS